MPTSNNDFEYSLCDIVLNGDWASFELGSNIANAIKQAKKDDMPFDYRAMLQHEHSAGLSAAFEIERERWISTGTIMPNYKDIDWKSIDPSKIGDLMLIFSIKYKVDDSGNKVLDKYKCRMVFRGDRYKNTDNHLRYASSIDTDALMLFLGIVASENLDMWKQDVATAFLYSDFPDGMVQYVRSPHGVPSNKIPYLFQLGHCPYGHPLASRQWQIKNESNLQKHGFTKIHSAGSILQIKATPTSDQVIAVTATDDMLFSCKFNSPMKSKVKSAINSLYSTTEEDPAINYLGLHIVRDFKNRTMDLTMPIFMDNMVKKYPLPPGASYPSCPMEYSKVLSKEDLAEQQVFLNTKEITEFQTLLGDLLWIVMHIKPICKFSNNFYSRTVSPAPTLFDYHQTLRVMHYCIGTKDKPRRIGGKYGAVLTATVDSSFASHADLKGQSCYSIHIGGGGAILFD